MTFLEILAILIAVNVFVFLLKKLSIPSVVSLILMGIVFGIFQLPSYLPKEGLDIIQFLAKFGLFFLMFTAGLEISWSMFLKERKDSFMVAFWGWIIPFVSGSLLMMLLGYNIITSITVGICMSITAEATKTKILLEYKKINTRLGALMIGAGIFDDVFGILAFALFSFVVLKSVNTDFSELVHLLVLLIAFFAGIFVQLHIGRHKKQMKYLEQILNICVIPFFFIEMGTHFSFPAVQSYWWLVVLITIIAMIGKIGGVYVSRAYVQLNSAQAHLMGWGMNSRGAVELALAFTGYQIGLLTTEIYSSIIIMTFVSTLIFPIVFVRLLKKNKNIMN